MKKILIIDDEPAICSSLTLALEDKYTVLATTNPLEGIKLLQEDVINLCLLDLRIGQYNGLEVLDELLKIDKNLIVIMMTAYGSNDTIISAIKKGAYTYLSKPLNINELFAIIEKGLDFQQLNEKVEYLSQELKSTNEYCGLIGRSPSMKNVFKMIEKLKDVDTTVLILGETGTGKELAAKAVHFSGNRKDKKFVEVNCAAIPEPLLEDELFGHKKGAFTGAIEDKQGKFEYADKGTIFLDEIGDMPLTLQAKLLRVLQEKEVTQIGSNEKKKIDVRIIAATNKDLDVLVEDGTFRQDLFYRLNVAKIQMPALRDKKQDLPLFFSYYIHKYNHELNQDVKGISREAEKKLINYNYPGNVRELANIFEHAILFCDGNIIELDDLPEEVKMYQGDFFQQGKIFAEDLVGMNLKDIEKRVIDLTLKKNGGHRRKTAGMLGISDKGLRNKIAEYDLD